MCSQPSGVLTHELKVEVARHVCRCLRPHLSHFRGHPRPGRTRRRFGALVLGMLIDAIFTAVTNRVRAGVG